MWVVDRNVVAVARVAPDSIEHARITMLARPCSRTLQRCAASRVSLA
jgi:hypothetical protein